jgi:hypothetical protein
MKEITPKHLRCTMTMSCPAVHRLPDGRLRIRGEFDRESGIDLATGEAAIIISAEYLPGLILEDEQEEPHVEIPTNEHV